MSVYKNVKAKMFPKIKKNINVLVQKAPLNRMNMKKNMVCTK